MPEARKAGRWHSALPDTGPVALRTQRLDGWLYVDIVHPPAWQPDGGLRVVDLDLDVILLHDGTLLLDDEDEFTANSLALAYPDDVVAGARKAADEVLAAVAAKAPPLGAEPDEWRQAAGNATSEENLL